MRVIVIVFIHLTATVFTLYFDVIICIRTEYERDSHCIYNQYACDCHCIYTEY